MLLIPHQMVELQLKPSQHTKPQMVELLQYIQEQPAMEELLISPNCHQLAHHMFQLHTQYQLQTVEPSPTHMLLLHLDMKLLPTLLNQPQTEDQLPMFQPKPAMVGHHHTLLRPRLKPQEMEEPSLSLKKLLQTEELKLFHNKLAPPQMVEPPHTLLKLPAMEELFQKLNQLQQPQMVELLHTFQEPQAMEDTLHPQMFHQPVHHMFHHQFPTQHPKVDTLPTHMSQPQMDMKQLPMTQSQPEMEDQ